MTHGDEAGAVDPLPPWSTRSGTLFGFPRGELHDMQAEIDLGVCSIGFDGTASTHVGSRCGPRAIREASLGYSSQQESRGGVELVDMGTGRIVRSLAPEAVDFGDLHVYPTNPALQVETSAREVAEVAGRVRRVLTLGGEHTIAYPCFLGVHRVDRARERRLGYVQIDHHFDFGDQSPLHGQYYHGSNARRISEIETVSPEQMAFVGQGDFTSREQYESLRRAGTAVFGMVEVRDRGFEPCLRDAFSRVLEACDQLYVSIDVDVCDHSALAGTGHVTIGGVDLADFVSIGRILRDYPVRAVDIVEVNPPRDHAGSAAHAVARLLFDWLFLESVNEQVS